SFVRHTTARNRLRPLSRSNRAAAYRHRVYRHAVEEFRLPRNHRRRLTFVLDTSPAMPFPEAAGIPREVVTPRQVMSHPFPPQECDNAEMDQDSKPLQHRKDQRVARGRAVKKRPQVRLTPTDILKLLPPPIVLSGSSLTAIERQLSRRRERLERAMNARIRRDFVPQSRNLRIPSVARLEGLAKQVTMLPTRRKCLKRREFQIYLDTVHRLRDAIVAAIRKIRQSEQRDYQQRYLARVGQ